MIIYRLEARLRMYPGQDVRIGPHVSPKGGEHFLAQLQALLTGPNAKKVLIHPTLVSNLVRNAKIEWPDVDLN
jgi:hypothetical protein